MASLTSVAVEAELSTGTWTDISADVVDTIRAQRGINGSGPSDRVAATGTFSVVLNNSASNLTTQQGAYTPGHANVRAGWGLGTAIRLRAAYAGTTYGLWRGTISNIAPEPGRYGTQRCSVQAVDWMDEAARAKIRNIATQADQRSDELLTTILTGIGAQPVATSFETANSTFAWAFDQERDEQTALLTVFQHIAASEMGQIYLRGDGTLVFENRQHRMGSSTADLSLNETMQDLTVTQDRADAANRFLVTVHPRTVDTSATTVLYSLGTVPQLTAGDTLTLLGPYGDPLNANARCGGTAMQAPTSGTDYTMNTSSGGGSADLTTQFAVTATFGSNGVRWSITNNSTQTGYITKLQARGKGVYDRQEVMAEASNTTAITQYGETVAAVDMTYEDSVTQAQAIADWLKDGYSLNPVDARSVKYIANTSSDMMTAALARDVSDVVVLTETMTGLSNDGYFIQGVQYEFNPDGTLAVSYGLTPTKLSVYWKLGVSLLETDTILSWA